MEAASPIDLQSLLENSGAVLRGHFILTSGRHSDVYFEKFRILEQPKVLSILCNYLASHVHDLGIELVAGPTTGGIIIAFEVARQLGVQALYIESEAGTKKLRRGASVRSGTKVLVVDDVLTTGTSIKEVINIVQEKGGEVAGVGVLIDRSEHSLDFGCPFFAAYRVEAKSYAPDEIPDWLAAIPPTKPGTRPGVD